MTLSRSNPRVKQRWGVLAIVVMALSLGFAAISLAVHDDAKFELDKNATNDLNVTKVGELGANISATATSITVCQTGTAPGTPFTILIEAERLTVTTNAAGSFGGNCSGTKRIYTVTRGVTPTTATTHSKGGVEGNISLVVAAPAKPGTDWNKVHEAVVADPNTKCLTLGLVECAYIQDGIGPTTFTGGSTKDHLPVSGWNHTSGASPDKAEILNAYAAKAIAADNHQILYFGMDRYAVDGSTDIGFWFFKEPVEAITSGPNAGGFTGNQSFGDILILGTFTQGGAESNVRVFKWVGTGGNESGTIQGPDGTFGDCTAAAGGDQGCATVNDTSIEVPWAYTFKGSAKSGWVPAGGFFEGGIDLTALGLDGCFSSFLAETRSSPEITAILKDFALGSFEACGSSLTTTPGSGATPSVALTDSNDNQIPDVSIGTGTVSVKDRAALNITGISSWSGTLKFYLCGPISTGTCTAGSNAASPNGVLISTHSVTQATTQPIDSNAATITSAGRYCWRGEFTSSTTGVPNAKDDSATECFEVLPVTPTLDTAAVASPVNFGSAIQDNATLSGTATQPGTNGPGDANGAYTSINATSLPAAGGKITFTLLKSDCSTLAAGTGTNPQDFTPISGDNTYGPVSFTPNAPGTYHWKAQYVPVSTDVNNIGSTHNALCDDTDETVVVAKAPTAINTAQSVIPNDSATVSVAAADQGTGNVQGSVKFRLYNSLANCQATTPSDTVGTGGLLYKETKNLLGNAFSETVSTTNTLVSVSTNTTVYWLVEFTSTNTAQFGRNSICSESTATTFVNDSSGGTAPSP